MFPIRPQRQPELLMSINFLLREMPCNDVIEKQKFVGYRDDGWGNTIRIVITTYLEYFGLDYNYHVSISRGGHTFYGHVGHPDHIESFFGHAIPDLVINSYDEVNNECHIKFVNKPISDETLKHCYLAPVITYRHTNNGCEIDRIVTLDILLDHALVNREIQV